MKVKTLPEAISRYGAIASGQWPNQNEWMGFLLMPEWFRIQVKNSFDDKGCARIYMNRDMREPLLEALGNVFSERLTYELRTFDGCFNIRDVRGIPGRQSTHSYGLAIDLNAFENKLGAEPRFSREFVRCFERAGFSWGGHFKRMDGMHFSYAWE